ncbi:(deoxy)nucleoside triphosphate pyrophosphohydrolase [Jonesia denitrificans]|jgi:8-oxo-dGTP diphosphatase|uniref:8-oxo-dGTP diphosphatase n=1 Tax=Jonesia denitrificans (strain ATCC 14870 / DSM 20603 / BCRC 15368 / CIP 55.134 / JCM 11481 / NBRC 15587 / NCTC 10816 / Prevot 55134) TaxID=471856 RepID=C7QYL0_JONDD|nr:NUDIX hydrolase [Jonesia denitrificans DSM 20603]ASE08433.1 (deoxy)nucleoside triphosphate pyrophosphohydrolase [Jonesia denitrificans]QXB43037.1 (deoxy)nucleoside triphosphate pyrophosphohydrolase [Jonesia denitrificans]SQH19831.1 CTP pyrophosphohydrolase [Jonesia denitrificans]
MHDAVTSPIQTVPRKLVVAAAIVDDLSAPTQMLAARRQRPKELAGQWEFPGGKVDPGETPTQALHRELCEELGVVVELGREVPGPDRGAWTITERHDMRLWLARVVEGTPLPLIEHDELLWLPATRFLTVPWLEADVRIVQHLASDIFATEPA